METTDKRSTKKYIIGALVITLSLVVISLSLSYAYYSNKVNTTGDTGIEVTSGKLEIDFVATKENLISATGVSLIDDTNIANVLAQANSATFSITLPTRSAIQDSLYTLYLTDITISDALKSPYLKWALYQGTTQISTGNFGSYTTGSVVLNKTLADGTVENFSIHNGSTQTYKLYIWLSNDANANQNSLLNQNFEAKIGYRAVSN